MRGTAALHQRWQPTDKIRLFGAKKKSSTKYLVSLDVKAKNVQQIPCCRLSYAKAMALNKKRKGGVFADESDSGFSEADLDGILSENDDVSEDDGVSLDVLASELTDSEPPAGVSERVRAEDLDDPDGSQNEPNFRVVTDANGRERFEYDEIDPIYDSDDSDAKEPVNTIGNIPLSFYDSYPHIGYDINGKKIMRPATGDALDALLDSIEIPKGWTGLTDPETGKPLNLSQDELELLRQLQMGEVPDKGHDPYPVKIPTNCHPGAGKHN